MKIAKPLLSRDEERKAHRDAAILRPRPSSLDPRFEPSLAKESDREIRDVRREQQPRMRRVDRAVIGETAEPRFLDRNGAVVRRSQRADRNAEPERHPARDDADRTAAVPALDTRDQHVVIRAENPAPARDVGEQSRDRAALQRRPEADDAAARQIAHAPRRFERDDAAEAVADEMHAIGAGFAPARAQALARARRVAEDA